MFVLIIVLSGFASAQPGESLDAAVSALLGSGCADREKTAVRVVDVRSGATVYDRNGDTTLIPASVMKLFTTAAALRYLGPSYRFETSILHTGQIKGGVIHGDIIVRGEGDPKLTPEELWRIAREIGGRGITRVTGDLAADDSFFDGRRMAPEWSARRTQRPYDAKLGALSVNFNTVAARVWPGEKPGDPLIVAVEPQSPYIKLVNKGATSANKNSVSARRVKSGGEEKLVVTGSMRTGSEGRVIYVNVDDPLRFAAESFKAELGRAGVVVEGGVRGNGHAGGASPLYVHKSQPLAVTLRELNRYSSNFVAEQIVKTIAARVNGGPGEHGAAMAAVKKFLDEAGVYTTGSVFADGSGLSRSNRVTAIALTDLLVKMAGRFDIGPDFVASLGIMGVDGSVRDRMEESPARALARAKTGTLAGVSSLAGYVAGKGGGLYAFAILQNDNSCYYETADAYEDRVVTAIHLLNGEKR